MAAKLLGRITVIAGAILAVLVADILVGVLLVSDDTSAAADAVFIVMALSVLALAALAVFWLASRIHGGRGGGTA